MTAVPRIQDPGHEPGWQLDLRFADALRGLGVGDRPLHLLVALSGGLDSTVLLYMLRFRCAGMPIMLTAAHLDHHMRPSSRGDADWVRGLCLAWGVPLESGEAPPGLVSENAARSTRYTFLREVATRVGAEKIVTAHHADDQAETVLFRILRGTGIPGLAGIPAVTASGIIRPMLGFWRSEIQAFAEANGVAWRTDPTNATFGPARNRLRLNILPEIEREISAAARRNLVSLAELARESEQGWSVVLRSVLPGLVQVAGDEIRIDRVSLAKQHAAIASRVVRKALRHFGIVPDRAGTGAVLTFITDAPSGREMQLAEGLRIRVEFGVARIFRNVEVPPDMPLTIPLPKASKSEFSGSLRLGGAEYHVMVRSPGRRGSAGEKPRWRTRFPINADQFPLAIRARAPGDRFRTAGGMKPLKKLMIEHRVPAGLRPRLPLVVDATGAILWIAGIGPAAVEVEPTAREFEIEIADA